MLSLSIDPELLLDDVEMIEDLVIAAVNQGLSKASKESQKRMYYLLFILYDLFYSCFSSYLQ